MRQILIANIIEDGRLAGPQTRIAGVAGALQGKVKTTVIMPEEESESFRKQCDMFGVPYKTFRISRITKGWMMASRYLTSSPFEIARLAFFLKKGGYDVVHVSGGSWQYKGVIAGKLAGKKILWHLNDTSIPRLFRIFFAIFSRYADGYIFASELSKKYYGSLVTKEKPEFVIPAPVDVGRFDPLKQYTGDNDLLRRWNGKIVIGMVANINPTKGVELLIRVAAALNMRADNLLFVVVGAIYPSQQRYFKRLQQLCNSLSVRNIEFIGGRDDVRPLLQRFDIYVCCSMAESSPISVWEAMAMEKPVVSTEVGDVPLYVQNGYNGFIVGVGDISAMSERLAVLVKDENMRREFGQRSRQTAVRELNMEKCAQRHLDAYTHVMSQF